MIDISKFILSKLVDSLETQRKCKFENYTKYQNIFLIKIEYDTI